MASPINRKTPQRRARATLRHILSFPVAVLATVLVLFDDLFRLVVKPTAAWLAALAPFRRIEAAIARLPPYPTLALFLIPMAIIWPIKLYALYLIGLGHLGLGSLAFVVAKVIGVGLAERLFAISRDKLLSIGWFANSHRLVIGVKDRVHLYLKHTRWWPVLGAMVRRIRQALRAVKDVVRASVRRLTGVPLFRRVGARLRRMIESRRAPAP